MSNGNERPIRTSRRDILVGCVALSAAAGVAGSRRAAAAQSSTTADFLFVQTAGSMRYDPAAQMLTLEQISPHTLFFADRPERIAGNMNTADFPRFWTEGTDSFLSDPPNADLSILSEGTLLEVVVVLRDPALSGADLRYTVSVIEGDLPATASSASVFIDIIGMPLTPLSYAGVRRRAWRRAVLY